MSEEHRALIDFLPFDVVITIAALVIVMLSVVSFARRFSRQYRRAPASV